jgi:hypothetical protein
LDGSTFSIIGSEHRYGENTKSLAGYMGGSIMLRRLKWIKSR